MHKKRRKGSQSARLIPKADRKKIHEYLFREGVLVAQKDFNLPKHRELDTKNLYVSSSTDDPENHGLQNQSWFLTTPPRRSSKHANP